MVVAEFAWEADMDFAVLDVQKKTATFGADEAVETVDVIRQDPHALPVLRLAVSAMVRPGCYRPAPVITSWVIRNKRSMSLWGRRKAWRSV